MLLATLFAIPADFTAIGKRDELNRNMVAFKPEFIHPP
jgi:hypothetical protein